MRDLLRRDGFQGLLAALRQGGGRLEQPSIRVRVQSGETYVVAGEAIREDAWLAFPYYDGERERADGELPFVVLAYDDVALIEVVRATGAARPFRGTRPA